ncbi:MAG: hypothetical protein P8Y72_17030 [Anaerolineales bacterium]
MGSLKRSVKQVWERVPFAANLEWQFFRRHQMRQNRRMESLRKHIAEWTADTPSPAKSTGKKVFVFSMIYLWIRYAAGLGLAFSGIGHDVTLTYLPFQDWYKKESRHQNAIQERAFNNILQPLASRLKVVSLFGMPAKELPPKLLHAVEALSERDYQYTRQVEQVNRNDPLYRLRIQRNHEAAGIFLKLLEEDRPDVVVVPNGLILEFGALFEVAKYLGIPVVSYEFGEQRDRIWIAQDKPVMFQDTREMWEQYQDQPFTQNEREKLEQLFASRRNASLWKQFSRQWQEIPAEGIQAVKQKVGLDDRPVVLMAANVIGDSLTLGRQVFSDNMTEWISISRITFSSFRPKTRSILTIWWQ